MNGANIQYKILGFLIVLLTMVIWSCSSDKIPTPSTSHPTTWNEVGNANFHGAKVLTSGLESCTSCHGDDYTGGDADVSCYKCHESYPHSSAWMDTNSDDYHGAFVLENNGDLDACSRCHGMDFMGGNTKVSCFTCHATYPHLSTWADAESPQYHGNYLKTQNWSMASCIKCHGPDFKGGESGNSCYTCHTTFPHTENWTSGETDGHGAYLIANSDSINACTECHGDDFMGGTSEVSCYTCHQSYPHLPNWNNASSGQFHGVFVKNADWNMESCQTCHGDDFTGGTSNVSCFTCHESFPHTQDNWYAKEGHGAWVIEKGWDTQSCAECHGSDFTGGTSETSCYTCHATFPHKSDWMNMSSSGSHGNFVKSRNWSATSCQSCHGSDLTGGTSNVSCYTCHTNYPHMDDWAEGEGSNSHGTWVANNNWDIESCQDCHGTDYLGGTSQVSCYTCHATYPHNDNWTTASSAQSHNKYLKTVYWSMESCKDCHGDDYHGGTSQSSCYTCHTGEQGPETCNTCHGSEVNFAPPKALDDSTDPSTIGVGAHQLHLEIFTACRLCHPRIDNFDDAAHLDGSLPAEVNENLQWNRETSTCGNAYCHGDENKEYKWN